MGALMPTKLEGEIDLLFSARGKFKNMNLNDLENTINGGDIRINGQFNLANFDLKLPTNDLQVEDFNTRIVVGGGALEQKLDLNTSVDQLSLQIESDSQKRRISIEKLKIESKFSNVFGSGLNFEALEKGSQSKIHTELTVDEINTDGLLPVPLQGVDLALDAEQNFGRGVSLEDFALEIRNWGIHSSASATSTFGDQKDIQSFSVKAELGINHKGTERIKNNVKTSGNFLMKIASDSKDMRKFNINGDANFKNFT